MSFALALMVGERNFTVFDALRGYLQTAVSPLQYAVSWPIEFFEWIGGNIASQKELLAENSELQAEKLLLQAEVQRLMALEAENTDLHGLLSSVKDKPEKFLIAKLLAVNVDNIRQEMVLNRGKNDNVYVGQPILDAYGFVGQVVLMSAFTSRVLLLTDVKSAIPVEVNRNGQRAIALGSGFADTLQLTNVLETADIKVGDLLVTSGLGSRFPEGYPVGVVTNITRAPGEKFLNVSVKTAAHLDQDRQVLLIWPKNYHE